MIVAGGVIYTSILFNDNELDCYIHDIVLIESGRLRSASGALSWVRDRQKAWEVELRVQHHTCGSQSWGLPTAGQGNKSDTSTTSIKQPVRPYPVPFRAPVSSRSHCR